MNHNRIITPYTAPDRWTPKEKALFDAGKCSWQTFDGPHGDGHCEKPSKPGASFGHCPEHERELLEDYWPDGSPRR